MFLRRVRLLPASRLAARCRSWHDVASAGRLGDATPGGHVPRLLRAHAQLLIKRPLVVTSVTAVSASAIGDILAQLFWASGLDARLARAMELHGAGYRYSGATAAMASQYAPRALEGIDPETGATRTVRFAALAGGLVGVVGELWFRRLLVVCPGWTYDAALRTVFDLSLFAPAVLGLVVGGNTLLATGDAAYVGHKLHHECVHSLGSLWSWWLGGVATSYLLIPAPWQPPFGMGLAVVWSAYVSLRLHRPTTDNLASERKARVARMESYLRGRRQWGSEDRTSTTQKDG
jgi:hypothetical protein